MTGLTNGTPLRVIRRKDRINWCIPFTYFLEDTELRKQVNDETRSRQVSSLFSYYKTKYSHFYEEKNPPHTHTKSINNKTVFVIFVYKNSMFITDLTKRHCQILRKTVLGIFKHSYKLQL